MSQIKINRSIEEIIIISSAIIMAITIGPFAVYRYANGQYLTAFAELISIAIMCGIGIYVWKTRNTKLMKVIVGAFMLTGLVSFTYVLGTSMLFWIYPTIMTVYFLNSIRVSIVLSSAAMLALFPILFQEKTTIEVVSIVVTLVICQLFGYLLSHKTRQHIELMESMVNKDGLTGILNRRALDHRLEFLYNISLRFKKGTESTASIILFDIDNFKAINDEYGHLEGDKILIELTKLFKDKIREVDQFYRYGGEEFVVITNGSDALKASELAEKMRLILETSQISEHTHITASFGVAEMQKLEQPKRCLERADNAMFRAKRAGKNRVFIANFDPPRVYIDKNEDLKQLKRN